MNCLDCERYLPAALASVQAQTLQDIEIIFWDNASTDTSADIAQAFGPRLRYFRSERTVPLGEARNLAIAQAKGDYIAFLDCDDIWRPGKLEKQARLLDDDPDIGLVCTDTEITDGKNLYRRLFAQTRPERGNVFVPLMKRQWISMSSAMLRRSALEDVAAKAQTQGNKWFDESLNVCEEADLFYRIAHDWKCDYVDEPLTVWRVHGNNTTFQKFGQFADETLRILAKHRSLYPDYDQTYPLLVQTVERRAAFQKAIALWQAGEGRAARRLISPHVGSGLKYRLFWWASFLPRLFFAPLARLYFNMPAWVRNQEYDSR